MKRINNIFKALALTFAAVSLLAACQQEPVSTVAKAVLGDVSMMDFAASNPAEQVVTVYSDGDWHTTAPDWITVTPDTGNGVTPVTVKAAENVDAGGMLEPRKDTLIISGNTLASRLIIIVSQEGDSYRNAQHLTLDKVMALADGKAFVLDDATVAAITTSGPVLSDGKGLVYAKTSQDLSIGNKVSIKGLKGTVNGLPAVVQVDELKLSSAGSGYSYPEPVKLNDVIASYAADKMEYVTVSGIVSGGALVVSANDVDYSIKQVDSPAELSISGLNGNKVELTGYSCGLIGANMFGIITTGIKDNGPAVVPRPDKLLYAKWRFTTSLLSNYAEFFGGTAGKLDKAPGNGGLYVPSNIDGNGKIEYVQIDKNELDASNKVKRIIGATGHPYVTGAWPGDYWLFSATDNYEYPAGTNLHIKYLTRVSATGQKYWMLEYFDGNAWQPADEYPVETTTETGEAVQYNFVEPTSNVAVECSWKLAAPCREPMFRMRCVANWQANGNGALSAPNGGTCRIADNDDDGEDAGPVFEVTDAPAGGGGGETGGLKPGTVVFEDDFEWLEPWATASSAGDAVGTNNPSATAPNVFTTEACKGFLDEAVTRGYAYFWGPTADGGWSDSLGDDNPKVLYLQKNYLKFGKTSYSAGIKLPPLAALSSTADIELTFDWCWQVTGAYKADLMTLVLKVEGDGSYSGDELTSAQSTVDGESKIEWQHASATISGATANTRISISPANGDPKVSNPERKQNRWYLDNIKIVVK